MFTLNLPIGFCQKLFKHPSNCWRASSCKRQPQHPSQGQASHECNMTRSLVSLPVADASVLAKNLKAALDARHAATQPPPSHLELLNLLAKAAGWRNYAALKARSADCGVAVPSPVPSPPVLPLPDAQATPPAQMAQPALSATVRKALQQFDADGKLVRLPNKLSVQQMAVWALWTQFAPKRNYTENEVNAIINAHHLFGDHATLRRELINMKLLGRQSDCMRYWKEPHKPSEEVQAFLHAWRAGVGHAAPKSYAQPSSRSNPRMPRKAKAHDASAPIAR